MNNWKTLNIPPTEDKEAVRRAYMTQLSKNNPEDDQEGFVKLRVAYEQILENLESQEPQPEDTPMAKFLQKMEEVYNNFERRIDTDEWKELLKDEVCVRIDFEDEASKNVLVFLASHYYLPQSVWKLLNSHFGWQIEENEQKQGFNRKFVNFVIASKDSQNVDYNLFTTDPDYLGEVEGEQYDRWLGLYYEIEMNIYDEEYDLTKIEQEIESIPIRHIYRDIQKIRKQIFYEESEEEILAQTEQIYKNNPNDPKVRHIYGLVLLKTGRATESLAIFKALQEEKPEDLSIKKGLIESLIELEEYEPARVQLLKILDKDPYEAFATHTFKVVTLKLIEIYEEESKSDPDNMDKVLTLAKHYLNDQRHDKCKALLEGRDYENASYYEYLADCYHVSCDYEKAIEFYESTLEIEESCRTYIKYTTALIDAKQLFKALIMVHQALRQENKDESLFWAYIHVNKGIILHEFTLYEQALEAYDKAIERNSKAAHIYINKAKSLKKLSRYHEMVMACEQSIAMFPYNTEAYTVQMEMFYDQDYFDRVIAIAEKAKEVGFESPRIMYHKARALRMLDRIDEARAMIEPLLEAEFDEDYRDYFYDEMARIEAENENYEAALSYIKKSIELGEDHSERYAFAGYIYGKNGLTEKSVELYLKSVNMCIRATTR